MQLDGAHRKGALDVQSERPGANPETVRFDDFEADLRAEELTRAGRKVRLAQQSFRVLAMLLERPGQLVTRQELCAQLWPRGTLIAYEQGLNTAVNRLREALRDSAETPRFIETLPKRGYRFIATIERTPTPAAEVAGVQASVVDAGHRSPGVEVQDQRSPEITARDDTGAAAMRFRPKLLFIGALGVAIALAIIGLAILFTRHSSTRMPGRHVTVFTSLPGQEIAPTFSPDGSHIAFAWNGGADAGNHFDLYVKSFGSERLLRLTHQPAEWITPAWSPDGSSIAFVRQMEEQAPGIFLISALGGSERSIVSQYVAVGLGWQISWSPNGRELAYEAYGSYGLPQVYIVELDSLETRPLAPAPKCLEAGEPAFSPDGERLALVCISSSGVYGIDVVQLPHGPIRELASILGNPQGLTWAVDGSHLIFAKDPGNGGELWQLGSNGELTQLPFGEEGSAPAVAARGDRIAYVRGRGTFHIWRADLTAEQPEATATRLIYSTRTEALARYSPDATQIAFQSNRSGSTEIWLTGGDGADPERITSFNGAYTSAPSWCSDGRRIAFDSRASGVSAIYVEGIGERVPRMVVTSQDNLSLPVWSQDCHWLFAIRRGNELYRFPAAGGPAERFSQERSNRAVVIGDRLVFTAMRAYGVLLRIKPVAGGLEEPLENMPKLGYPEVWMATQGGIYYTASETRPITVRFYDFATRTPRTLMSIKETPTPAGAGLEVSADGHWLLYSQLENKQSEIVLAPAH
jgi:Tol biopolymer transport system component/DNA-binding winged helix-turn-helix (wHTH) protein